MTSELIKVVPLRLAAKRLGVERLVLKGGRMYLYFVGKENVAYYNSQAFGRIISYYSQHPAVAVLREGKGSTGKNSMTVEHIDTVSKALDTLRLIESLEPA